jgi:hypothetical protein
LSILVVSPGLLGLVADSIDEMRLANLFCWAADFGQDTNELFLDGYPTGGRSGKTIGLYVSDPRKARTGRPIEARGEVHRQVHRLFGFPLGTKKNAAAALYLSDRGATTEEIRKEIGEAMLNLLKEVKIQGHTVSEIKEKSPRGRFVTRYKIIPRKIFP